jgi:hypothetical protein
MSFGYSVGDFIAVGTLAWNVYKLCKAAPVSFGNISMEVPSLHVVIKEAEKTVSYGPFRGLGKLGWRRLEMDVILF